MPGNPRCTVYVGGLDERVSERVLYDILIQAGRIVDLHFPKDRETEKPKGFAFAEYETEEIADYAIKLFSGLVTLYNRTLKFGISGQDKIAQSQATPPTNSTPNSSHRPRPQLVSTNNMESSRHSTRTSSSSRFSSHPDNYSQEPPPPGVSYNGSHSNDNDYRYSRRAYGSALDSINSTRSRRHDTSNPIYYPSY